MIPKYEQIITPTSKEELTKFLDNMTVSSGERFVAGRAASMGFNLAVKLMEDHLSKQEAEAQQINKLAEEALSQAYENDQQ